MESFSKSRPTHWTAAVVTQLFPGHMFSKAGGDTLCVSHSRLLLLPPASGVDALTLVEECSAQMWRAPHRRGYSQEGTSGTRYWQELPNDYGDPQVQQLRMQDILPVFRQHHFGSAGPSSLIRVPYHPDMQVSCCPHIFDLSVNFYSNSILTSFNFIV